MSSRLGASFRLLLWLPGRAYDRYLHKVNTDYTEKKDFFSHIQDDDDVSFGSISTKGSMCSGTLSIMWTSSLLQRPSILKRQDSQHSGKSARFNETMNETVEYSLDIWDHQEENTDADDEHDINSAGAMTTRSAGGQAKYLTPNKSMKLRADQHFDASVVGTSSKDDTAHPRLLETTSTFNSALPTLFP